MTHYPFFEARGTPAELGRQHGEQAREQIRGFVDFLAASLKVTRAELRARAAHFVPLMERTCPHLLEETRGLAAGASIENLEALACQLRGELAGVAASSDGGSTVDGGCTTFVLGRSVTAQGETLIGQNSDNPAELMDYAYVLRVSPDAAPRFVMWTFGGMLGYHGVNEHGVAHFANALGGGPGWKFALSHYPVKRLIFECRTLEQVRDLFRRVPVCSNGNYVLSDGQGNIADVELTSDGPFEVPASSEGFLAHSNHYVCGAHACEANFQQSLPDSFGRLDRMTARIRERSGSIRVEDVKSFLSDHEGHPTGICRHAHHGADYPGLPASGLTVCSLIAEADQGLLHVARGNPCENPFATYSVHG